MDFSQKYSLSDNFLSPPPKKKKINLKYILFGWWIRSRDLQICETKWTIGDSVRQAPATFATPGPVFYLSKMDVLAGIALFINSLALLTETTHLNSVVVI